MKHPRPRESVSMKIEESAIESVEAKIQWIEHWLPDNQGKEFAIASLRECIVHIKQCFVENAKKK